MCYNPQNKQNRKQRKEKKTSKILKKNFTGIQQIYKGNKPFKDTQYQKK